jgi:lipopolysaccharide export system permease protein
LEALGLYLIGFSGFLGFLLINKLFLEAPNLLRPGFPVKAAILVVLLETPYFITLSLPIAVIFATLMSMGRLGKDNELMAMFTNGISLYRLFMPFLVLSSASVLFSYFTNEYLLTAAASAKQRIYDRNPGILQQQSDTGDPFIVRLDRGEFVAATYFDKQQGRLANLVMDDWNKKDGQKLMTAETAQTTGNRLVLGTDLRSPAVIFDKQIQGKLYERNTIEPSTSVDLGVDLKTQVTALKTPQELTQTELAEQSKLKEQRGENPAMDRTDFHLRFSGPFASLAFALVAMPLSLKAPRDERLLGLIWCFLLVMLYYVIFFICKQMGYNGFIQPWIAAWTMNIVFGVLSLFIFVFSRK